MDVTTMLTDRRGDTTSATGDTAYGRGQGQDAAETAVVLHRRGEASCLVASRVRWSVTYVKTFLPMPSGRFPLS